MSADNGIYILKTRTKDGWEYRVAHLQAVENYLWDGNRESDDPDVHIKNAREMWAHSRVYTRAGALDEAARMADDEPILEYGISTITIAREF